MFVCNGAVHAYSRYAILCKTGRLLPSFVVQQKHQRIFPKPPQQQMHNLSHVYVCLHVRDANITSKIGMLFLASIHVQGIMVGVRGEYYLLHSHFNSASLLGRTDIAKGFANRFLLCTVCCSQMPDDSKYYRKFWALVLD